jgi:transcription antitermination factor NusG
MKHVILIVSLLSVQQYRKTVVESFTLVPFGQVHPHHFNSFVQPTCPQRISRGQEFCTRLKEGLWDRLDIEEDEEPQWYVLNCVAGLEIDLLRQCRDACGDMADVVKFVVPTTRHTRSHGANRMITEEKVQYPGYVFAKLRLCPDVYEAVRTLSLCRSWMGTVNQKGYRKLPPAPVALSEEEIINFGLEDVASEEEEAAVKEEDESGVILDSEDDNDEKKEDSKKKFEEKALKVYLGLRVDDMVKVTAKGKFFNEDGIVRRLKEGKILVRFYTYGTMYDEWLEPGDVRKLSNVEILKGLSGPSQPITQDVFDGVGREGGASNNDYRDRGPLRRDLMSNVKGAVGPRNRRQDRVERGDRFNNNNDRFSNNNNNNMFGRSPDQRRREEPNGNFYQDRQRQPRTEGPAGGRFEDKSRWNNNDNYNDNRRPNRYDSALSDDDSQWGRGPPSSTQRDRRPYSNDRPQSYNNDRPQNYNSDRPQSYNNDRRPNNYRNNINYGNNNDNRRVAKAIDGNDDWSAFVAPADGRQKQQRASSGGNDEDEFFASLMSDLNEAVGSGKSSNDKPERRRPERNTKSNDGDDFFASLMSEISTDNGNSKAGSKSISNRKDKESADDFFAALEAELGSAFDTPPPNDGGDRKPSSSGGGDDADDFFARLEAEMATTSPARETTTSQVFADPFKQTAAEQSNDVTAQTNDAPNHAEGNQQDATQQTAVTATPASPPKRRKVSKLASTTTSSSKSDDNIAPPKQAMETNEAAPPSSSSSKPNPAALDKCTVPVLKEMLRERGLKITGKKSELIERLRQ